MPVVEERIPFPLRQEAKLRRRFRLWGSSLAIYDIDFPPGAFSFVKGWGENAHFALIIEFKHEDERNINPDFWSALKNASKAAAFPVFRVRYKNPRWQFLIEDSFPDRLKTDWIKEIIFVRWLYAQYEREVPLAVETEIFIDSIFPTC